jgi:hypothetical protein
LKKGDLGGFENLQTEGIFGKRYNIKFGPVISMHRNDRKPENLKKLGT